MAANTVCGWWTTTIGGYHGEAHCALEYGHESGHQDAHGPVNLPTGAVRVGDMCAAHDEDDSGGLCAREPGHVGQHRTRSGYPFGEAEEGAREVEPLEHPDDAVDPAVLPADAEYVSDYLSWRDLLGRHDVDPLGALLELYEDLVWESHFNGGPTLDGAHDRIADAIALVTAARDLARTA